MNTDGVAEIRRLDGKTDEFPITKIKYTISASTGIKVDVELGEPVFSIDRYLGNIERAAADLEQAEKAAIKQLSQ
jgi:hypothetical protein